MQARALTIRLVRLAMAASLIVPRLLFAFASWNSYRNLKALTDERLTRSLEVQQEETQKTFQLVDLALNTTSDLVAGMSDSDIRKKPDRPAAFDRRRHARHEWPQTRRRSYAAPAVPEDSLHDRIFA